MVASPSERKKPSIAGRGAPRRGPRRSSVRSGCSAGIPSAMTARRRGVTYPRMSAAGISAAASLSRTSPVKSPIARRCIRAGISSDSSSSSSSGMSIGRVRAGEPSLAAGGCERPDAENIGSALGDADRSTRVEQIEQMARLQALVIGGQRQPAIDQCRALLFGVGEMGNQPGRLGKLEIIGGKLPFGAAEDRAVGDPARSADAVVIEIEDVLDTLDIHRQPFEPVGQLGRDRVTLDPADLLEVGELADLHAVYPDLPAESPG